MRTHARRDAMDVHRIGLRAALEQQLQDAQLVVRSRSAQGLPQGPVAVLVRQVGVGPVAQQALDPFHIGSVRRTAECRGARPVLAVGVGSLLQQSHDERMVLAVDGVHQGGA